MIVRDEAPVIKRALDSVLHLTDTWLICDTGSTDGTPDIITKYFAQHNKPGELYHKPWVNFGHNKSDLLKRAYETVQARYLFWLDADEIWCVNQPRHVLYSRLEQSKADVFMITTRYANLKYYRWNIVRNNQLFYWWQPVHEVLLASKNENPAKDYLEESLVYLVAKKEGNSCRPGSQRKLDDIRMFHEFLEENANEPRAVFYLAQSYQEAGQLDNAIKYYQLRRTLTGYVQERFIATLRLARIYRYRLKDADRALEMLDAATKEFPGRLEAWYEKMLILQSRKDWAGAFLVAAESPIENQAPSTRNFLFCEIAIYEWRMKLEGSVVAYYAEQYETAYAWGTSTKHVPPQQSELIKNNFKFYKGKWGLTPRCNVIVIDHFLEDAEAVRQFALAQKFEVTGNYPGSRTKSFASDFLRKKLERYLGTAITSWSTTGYNGAYQLTTKGMTSWIHRDATDCAAVLYLTPGAPLQSGTNFYRHKRLQAEYETPLNKKIMDADSNSFDKWEIVDSVSNMYNRMVIFNGRRSHMSGPYFGNTKEDGRLFQTFFFNVSSQQ